MSTPSGTISPRFHNPPEEAGLSVVHGAGHSSPIIKAAGSHLKYGVMQDGNKLAKNYRNYGLDDILTNRESERRVRRGVVRYEWGNDLFRLAMMARYGTNKATDNYGKTKK